MNKSICNFLLFIILLVLAVLFFGCEKPTVKVIKEVIKENVPFRITQRVDRLNDGSYCLNTILWSDEPCLSIISRTLVFEDSHSYRIRDSWHVKSINDSIKHAHYNYMDSVMNYHIRKIKI